MANETLLIIEADHDITETLRTYFSARGYTVWVAADGAYGLQLAQTEHPALIIISDTLPDMPAYEVVEAWRADVATASIRFILLQHNAERADQIAGLVSDNDDLISIPFDLEEVHLRVKNIIDQNAPVYGNADYSEDDDYSYEDDDDEEIYLGESTLEKLRDKKQLDDILLDLDEGEAEEAFGGVPLAPAAEAEPMSPPPPPRPIAPPAPIMPAPAITPPQAPSRQRPLTESVPGAKPVPSTSEIQFGAYHPREIIPNEWKPLIAYIYYDSAETDVQADAGKQLGALMSGFRKLTQAAKGLINEGATITATPHLPGFQCNPPSVAVAFYEDWHRFDFKLRAKDAPLYQAANGLITFTVEGVIVGDVPLSIYVTDKEQDLPTTQASSKIYDTIFCSYSRKDVHIVERVERAYKALGMDYLRDMTTLRAGEEWSDELKALITRANIFQLFWSPAASLSDHVRMEWEYALTIGTERTGFIRPVYWTQPIPAVPPTLSHLHFAYQPDLVE